MSRLEALKAAKALSQSTDGYIAVVWSDYESTFEVIEWDNFVIPFCWYDSHEIFAMFKNAKRVD